VKQEKSISKGCGGGGEWKIVPLKCLELISLSRALGFQWKGPKLLLGNFRFIEVKLK
jgi:hypothetical protein